MFLLVLMNFINENLSYVERTTVGIFFYLCLILIIRFFPFITFHHILHIFSILCSITLLKLKQLIFYPQPLRYRDGIFIVHYYIGDKLYSIPIRNNIETRIIMGINDENENDITGMMRGYLGPNLDFHRIPITPKFFDKKSIKIRYVDLDEEIQEKNFNENENIFL